LRLIDNEALLKVFSRSLRHAPSVLQPYQGTYPGWTPANGRNPVQTVKQWAGEYHWSYCCALLSGEGARHQTAQI